MADVYLSKAVPNSLLNHQSTTEAMGKTQQRLATGLRANSALDNPTNSFTAQTLNARSSDLSNLLDGVSNAIQTVEAADTGIKAITKLVQTAQATVTQAAAGSATSASRAAFAEQFNDILDQIDALAGDSGFNGVNLLGGATENLKVSFNEDGSSSITISGVDVSADGLGLTDATGDFASDAEIESKLTDLSDALVKLRSQASSFGSSLSVIETRQDFTKNMISTLETGAANLTLTDTNEEAANLLALQIRQQLSSTALSLASQADQQILRLF